MLINPNIAIIESLPGVGGDESKLWMEELLSSYLRFAQKKGFKYSNLDENSIKINGEGAYNLFKNFSLLIYKYQTNTINLKVLK